MTEAEHTTNTNRTELNARMDVIEARQEANVHAATDTNADYAAELVDVRVTKGGKTCASAGEAIRSEVQRLEETIASAEGSAVEKSKLACLGSMGNLARAYRKAGPTVTNGAVKEPGEFLAERITSKTHYGQLYTRFVNEQEGRAWQYLYICKVKEIIGSAGHMSCYQYSADHENLNTHVTKNIKVMYRDEMYTVGYGDILENAHEIYLSPVVLAVDAVAECDEYCMLIDVSSFEKEELDELLLVIKQSPEESKGIITTVLIAAFAILFGFYSTDAFIYTTGIAVRSVNQLVIDLYRYAIGFVGSAMIIWITYMLYPVISQKLPVVCKSLVYCGKISLLIYIIDCLINAYILPRITKDFSPNYVIACVETLVSMVFIIGIDWLIKKIPLARKLLLGNR